MNTGCVGLKGWRLPPALQTIISGEFDQSALHDLFNRIRDLGITLISMQRIL